MSIKSVTDQIMQCTKCAALRHDLHTVLKLKSHPDVLFIGEVINPQNGTEVLPSKGRNTAGYYFHKLLDDSGCDYVYCSTNALLCPPTHKYDARHLDNCLPWLRTIVDTVQPRIVVPLGRTATLQCCKIHDVYGQERYFFSSLVGKPVEWYDRYLFPLTHPSGNAVAVKPLHLMQHDFIALRNFVHSSLEKENNDARTDAPEE